MVTLDNVSGTHSDSVSFTTTSCEPDPPQAPKLVSRTVSTLTLKWNVSGHYPLTKQLPLNNNYLTLITLMTENGDVVRLLRLIYKITVIYVHNIYV